jgi:hypothetical protein
MACYGDSFTFFFTCYQFCAKFKELEAFLGKDSLFVVVVHHTSSYDPGSSFIVPEEFLAHGTVISFGE